MNIFLPEKTEFGEIAVDIYQKLSNNRVLFICEDLNDKLSSDIVAALMLKDIESEDPIRIYINSEGGSIRNALMIYDAMQLISAPIQTFCIGSAMDEAALILAAGTPGMRFATKHSSIAVAQLTNTSMAFSDLTNAKANLDLVISDNKKMMNALSSCTKKPLKEITQDLERRVFMSAADAVKYNLIDKVVAK